MHFRTAVIANPEQHKYTLGTPPTGAEGVAGSFLYPKTVDCPPTGHFLSAICFGNAANLFYGLSGDSPWCQVTGRGDGNYEL